jgi:lipoic acid synthetase/lipoate-protein ligase A
MIYINLPDNTTRRLSFYLAMEEYVAQKISDEDCFFMWQVDPSVIFGRNQNVYAEVNLDYCRAHGIQIYRRKSGGGCVYADRSNVMMSYMTKGDEVQTTFESYLKMVVEVLKKMNVKASWTEHNDIMIGDRKVSDNAFYHLPGRSIVHGTMLYDTNMENMVGSITPSDEKLIKHGVESVRQRITLLKDHSSFSLEEFKSFFRKNLCSREITVPESDLKIISSIEKGYLDEEWIYGHQPNH